MRSVTTSQVASNLKNNPDFKNRKRKNDIAKDFLHGQQHDVEVLTRAFERRKELILVAYADKEQSRQILKKDNHYKKKRHSAMVTKHAQNRGK